MGDGRRVYTSFLFSTTERVGPSHLIGHDSHITFPLDGDGNFLHVLATVWFHFSIWSLFRRLKCQRAHIEKCAPPKRGVYNYPPLGHTVLGALDLGRDSLCYYCGSRLHASSCLVKGIKQHFHTLHSNLTDHLCLLEPARLSYT